MEEYQLTLKIAAYFLEYPDEEWRRNFSEYRKAAEEISTPQVKNAFSDLFDYVENMGFDEYENLYVRSFDFSQNTNLYLTMHNRTDFGKQSQEMHEFKTLFLENGYDLNKELPDYLPAILELASTVPRNNAKKILDAAKNKIELLRDRFIEAKLAQAFLLDTILTQAERLGGD